MDDTVKNIMICYKHSKDSGYLNQYTGYWIQDIGYKIKDTIYKNKPLSILLHIKNKSACSYRTIK